MFLEPLVQLCQLPSTAFSELCRICMHSSGKLSRLSVVYFVSKTGNDQEYKEGAADAVGPLNEFLTFYRNSADL